MGAKSIDQKRAVRNYGRTFEFQNVQLKPTVPNDRRPAKAKRMDNMWTQTLAKKQGVQINHLPSTPKPKVPWTMKKNPQPEKKVEDKEVDDFEKCRDTLKNSTGNSTPALGKDIKTIQKMTAAVNKPKKNDIPIEKEIKEEKSTEKGSTKEDVDSNKTSVTTQSKSEKENLEDNIEISKSTEENIKVGKKMENVIIN